MEQWMILRTERGTEKSEEVAQYDVMYAKRDDKRAIGAFVR